MSRLVTCSTRPGNAERCVARNRSIRIKAVTKSPVDRAKSRQVGIDEERDEAGAIRRRRDQNRQKHSIKKLLALILKLHCSYVVQHWS